MTPDEARRIVQAAGLGVPVVQTFMVGNRGAESWISIRVPNPYHPQIAAAIEVLLNAEPVNDRCSYCNLAEANQIIEDVGADAKRANDVCQELREENARLKQIAVNEGARANDANDEADQLRAENARLSEWLRKDGRHKRGCAYDEHTCSCGLYELLDRNGGRNG